MESVLPLAVETFLLLFLRKRPTLLIVVAAVAILFVPIPDNASNLKLQKFYGDKTTMKAAVYVPNGDFEVTQVPLPQFHNTLLESVTRVKATQLLIRVKAAAINPVDFKLRLPTLPILRWFIPNSVGRDFSGVVEMVIAGDDECTFRPGDEIFGVSAFGALQEFIIAPCATSKPFLLEDKALKPKDLPWEVAASLPIAAGTSLDAITRHGDINGKRVLVIGASGGTGSAGVNLAHLFGAHVTAICSKNNAEFVKGLGADETFKKDLDAAKPFDLIYDTVSSPHDFNYVPLAYPHKLTASGWYVAIAAVPLDIGKHIVKVVSGKDQMPRYELVTYPQLGNKLTKLAELASREVDPLEVPFDTFYTDFTTETVKQGYSKLARRRARGKIVYKLA